MRNGPVAGLAVAWIAVAAVVLFNAAAQAQSADAFTSAGQVAVDGTTMSYTVRHLPASAFPALPAAVVAELNRRGCLIPQTYEAHRPENVIHGSFRRAGSTDWALLCSVRGVISLLVFFEGQAESAVVLATAPETERLEAHGASGVLGFAWGIDVASPELVHEAQAGMRHRPARLDHDAVADSIIDGATVYHFYAGSAWTVVDTRD